MKWLGFILGHICRFAASKRNRRSKQSLAVCLIAIPAGALLTGVEALAIQLLYPSLFSDFTTIVPVRFFIYALLIIIFYPLYNYFGKSDNRRQTPAVVDASPSPANIPIITDRITVRIGQKIKIIPVDQILYIKAEGDYISICTDEGEYLKEQTMKYTEATLNPDIFVRIHRSYIVNVERINRIERYGEYQQVVLSNGEKIKVSAARYRVLRRILRL